MSSLKNITNQHGLKTRIFIAMFIVNTFLISHYQSQQRISRESETERPGVTTRTYLIGPPKDSRHYEVYKPEGAVGLRYKKQIFTKRDLGYIGFSSHVLESIFRKKYFLDFFTETNEEEQLDYDDYLVSEVCPSAIFSSDLYHATHYCSQDMMVFTYLSTNYYKPKNDYIQSPFKNETVFWGGIQIQSPDQKGNDFDFPRDSFYLNYALGVKNTFEVPQAPIEEVEIEGIIESFLYKKAKTNNRENFLSFATRFGPEMMEDPSIFSSLMYTFDDVEYIASLTGGLKPQSIKQLPQSNPLNMFFQLEFEVSPSHRLTFEECELLIPKRYIITIDNLSKSKTLDLLDFRATSPELTPYIPHSNSPMMNSNSFTGGAKDFPLKLGPLSSLELHLVFLPETLGAFEAAFYILVNDVVFVGSVSAMVVPNPFQLSPIYVVDVTVNERVEVPVQMFNPLATSSLIIQELWSTDRYAQLVWPNGQPIPQTFDELGNAEPPQMPLRNSEYLKLQPMNESEVFHIIFQVNQTQDYYAEVHILTDHHDIIRLPIYFHVHSDVVKFLPPTADFGLVPLNFDLMKISVRGRNKAQERIKILDVNVPIQDQRLDFVMMETKFNPDVVYAYNPGSEFLLGYVILQSSSPGLILQKIIVIAQGMQTNKTYKLEYMITGKVMENPHILQGNLDNETKELYKDYAPPIVSFDVGEYLMNQHPQKLLFVIPTFRPVILTAPLVIKNTFSKPILIKGIVNNNKEIKVTLIPGLNPDFAYNRLILQPNQIVKFAQIEILTTHLKISQGIKYIQIEVNDTYIPAAVQIYDRQLTCVWEEPQKQRYIQCAQGYDINFGYIPNNDTKIKRVNITNLNPFSITIETVTKTQQDDMIVFVEKMLDKQGKRIPITKNLIDENRLALITQRKTKKVVNITIKPQHTFSLCFQVIGTTPRQKSTKIDFIIRKKETSNFTFNYQYNVIEGNISLVPSVIRFNSALTGQVLTKPLIVRSTFDIAIVIKQMTSSDPRIYAQFLAPNLNIIMPRNKTEIAQVSLDVNKMTHNSMMLHSLENAMFGTHHAFEQQLPQHIVQLINSAQVQQNGGQITMIMNEATGKYTTITQGQGPNKGQNYQQQLRTYITAGDLLLYKEKQKIWDDLGAHGKTEINGAITIETNVFPAITVQVKAHLTKPCITNEDQIDFGIVQVGSESFRSIKIVNPSDQPIQVALFLTSEPLNEAEVFNTSKDSKIDKAPSYSKDKKNQRPVIWSEYLFGYDLDLEHPIIQYCNQITDINLIIDSSLMKETLESEELFINFDQPQNELCSMIRLVLNTDIISKDQKDAIVKNVEHYFKNLLTPQLEISASQIEKTFKQNIMQLNKNLLKGQSQMQIDLNKMKLEDIIRDLNENSPPGGGIGNHLNAGQQVNMKELEILAGKLNKVSFNHYLDQNVLGILKALQQVDEGGFLEWIRSLLKQPVASQKMKLMRNATTAQQALYQDFLLKQELKRQTRFRFKNELFNDIIINRDSSKITNDIFNFSNNKPFQISNQSFYINPTHVGVVYKVEAKSDRTIPQAVVFQPLSLQNKEMKMHLIIKNDLTHLYQVELVGKSGTGLLEFNQVLKKHPFTDGYIAMPNLNHQQSMNYFHQQSYIHQAGQNSQDNSQSDGQEEPHVSVIKKILNYIYGEKERLFENKSPNMISLKQAELERVVYFNIAAEDMIPINQDDEDPSTGDTDSSAKQRDYHTLLSDLLTYRFDNIKLVTSHRRIFIAQNIGNLPITIDSISIEGQGCSAFGIEIENCSPFTLKPGEAHQLKISFTTDYSVGKMRKTILLESKLFTQEVILQVQMPISLLPLANQILPLTSFEESFYICIKLAILGLGAVIVLKISQDIVSHLKFKLDQKKQQRLNLQVSQEHIIKINQPVRVKEIPVIKDILGNDQITNTFLQANEKLENPNQLLLKEIANLCSNKKSLVILDAQKQAIDAEKERRKNNNQRSSHFNSSIHQNSAANKYFENRMREEQLLQQIQQQIQQQQQQQAVLSKSQKVIEKRKEQDSFTKVQAGRNQGQKQRQLAESVASSNTSYMGDNSPRGAQEETPKRREINQALSSMKVQSAETKKNKSPDQTQVQKIQVNADSDKLREAKETDVRKGSEQTDNNLDSSQNATDSTAQAKAGTAVKTAPRMSKKQQRQTAQRIKEQQEMEERYRQAEKRKEEEAKLEQKRKEIELQRALDLAKRAEEELRILKEQEAKQIAQAQQEYEAGQTGTDSLNQSLNLEKDNSLNLSNAEDRIQKKSASTKEQREREFKRSLDYIGDLNEDKSTFQKQAIVDQSRDSQNSQVSKNVKTSKEQNIKRQQTSSQNVNNNLSSSLNAESQSDRDLLQNQKHDQSSQVSQNQVTQQQTYTRKVFIDQEAVAKLAQKNQISKDARQIQSRGYNQREEIQKQKNRDSKFQIDDYYDDEYSQEDDYQSSKQQRHYSQYQIKSKNYQSHRDESNYEENSYSKWVQKNNSSSTQIVNLKQQTSNQNKTQVFQKKKSSTNTIQKVEQISTDQDNKFVKRTQIDAPNKMFADQNNTSKTADPRVELEKLTYSIIEDDSSPSEGQIQETARFQFQNQSDSQKRIDTSVLTDHQENQEENKSFEENIQATEERCESDEANIVLEQVKQDKKVNSPKKLGGQLSKEELKPFFESQKMPEEVKKVEQKRSLLGNLISPNNSLGQSIFSFNPMNIFTQPIGVTTQPSHRTNQAQSDFEGDFQEENSPLYEKDLSKLIDDEEDEDHIPFSGSFANSQFNSLAQSKYHSLFQSQVNSQLNSQRGVKTEGQIPVQPISSTQQQSFFNYKPHVIEDSSQYEEAKGSTKYTKQGSGQNTDFYNTFKSASSLFAKPLFGGTIQKINEAQQQNQLNQSNLNTSQMVNQPFNTSSSFVNQSAKQQDDQNSSSSFLFNQPDQDEKDDTIDEQDDEDENYGGSLFSGSLFGDGGIFGSTRKSFNNNQQHQQSNYQPSQLTNQPYSEFSGQPTFREQNYMFGSGQIPNFVPTNLPKQPATDEIFFPPPGLSLPSTTPPLNQNAASFTPPATSSSVQSPPGLALNPYQQQFLQQQQIRNVQFQPQTTGTANSLFGSTFGLGFAGNSTPFNQTLSNQNSSSTVPPGLNNPIYQNAAQQLLQQQQQQQYQLQLIQQLQLQQLQQQLQAQNNQQIGNTSASTPLIGSAPTSLHSQLNLIGGQPQLGGIWAQPNAAIITQNTQASSIQKAVSDQQESVKSDDGIPQSSVDDLE